MKIFNVMFSLAVTFAVLPAFAIGNTVNIAGKYECKGYDPFAKINYSGVTTVTKTGNTYQFVWNYGKKQTYHGTALFNVNEDNMLGVVFADSDLPAYTGIQLYQIQADGSLVGNWTIMGKSKVANETCTPIK